MAFYHGLKTRQQNNSVPAPIPVTSGITFAVGTAPIHTVNGKVNEVVMATDIVQAKNALGYSDDWKKYTLCEVISSHFELHPNSPVFFVNTLNPAVLKSVQEEKEYNVVDGVVALPYETIINDKFIVKSGESTYKKEEDFDVYYDSKNLLLEILPGSTIPENTTKLKISFETVTPELIAETEIIGGYNLSTKKSEGFELVDTVFPKYGIIPGILIAPGFSQKPTVAAVMAAKSENINGIFYAKAYTDIDTEAAPIYTEALDWKKQNGIISKYQYPLYGLGVYAGKAYHLSSIAAARTAQVDAENECPTESPSNKEIKISGLVTADGTEIYLDPTQANLLNANGIATAINFTGNYVLWGNCTACFPYNQNPEDYFINVSRMFDWVRNTIVLTCWVKLDKNIKRRIIQSIVDQLNTWLNALTSDEKILGGRVEFSDDENSAAALAAGKAVFHVYLTPPSPLQEADFIIEYDFNNIIQALAT